jgi:hypothetical protein
LVTAARQPLLVPLLLPPLLPLLRRLLLPGQLLALLRGLPLMVVARKRQCLLRRGPLQLQPLP